MKVLLRKKSCYRFVSAYHTRLLHNEPNAIVIAAAVRTPWVKRLCQQYPSVTATHLSTVVVEAAVKQSGAPLEKVQMVYMADQPVDDTAALNDLQFGELLKKAKHISVAHADKNMAMKSLLMGMDDVKYQKSEIVVAGAVQLASKMQNKENHRKLEKPATKSRLINEYISHCEDSHLNAFKEGIFDAELIPLRVIKHDGNRKQLVELTQDDIFKTSGHDKDGAAALVLTTKTNAEKYNIRPLAAIEDIVVLESTNEDDAQSTHDVIQFVMDKTHISQNNIHHWQFNTNYHSVFDLQKHFRISWERINPYGGISTIAHTGQDYLLGSLSHIAHALKPNEHGCVVSSNGGISMAILLKKLPTLSPANCVPRLTLFTKDPCHLCDILVEELECNFAGEYDLEKIYIDDKENVRYLRLYRHDIPVLYLNGQFLCMHHLNVRLLRWKLNLLKETQNL